MELRLQTITPVHVGDGSSLHSLDYVVHNGRFYRISQRLFENFLKALEEKGISLSDRFAVWAVDIAEKMQNIESERLKDLRGKDYNQQLSDLRRKFSLYEFAKSNGQEQAFLDFVLSQKSPGLPINTEDRSIQEIRGFLRDANSSVYLPGSSIKGSIRTALLYHFLDQYADHEEVRKILRTNLEQVLKDQEEAKKRNFRFNLDKHRKHFGEELEFLAFRAGMIPEKGGAPKYSEAQDDLLKCLLVSDTYVQPDGVGIEKIDLYLVKKLPKGAGYKAQQQRQAPAVEAIQPGQILKVNIDVNIDLLLELHRKSQDDANGMKVGREKHWIGWREKAAVVFGLTTEDFNSVPAGSKPRDAAIATLHKKAITHILGCCKKFSDAQALALAKWQKEEFCLPKHNAGALAGYLEKGIAYVFAARGVRFHLGYATGFQGVTAVLYFLKHHEKTYKGIMELFGIGDSPSAWKNRRPNEVYVANPDKFPKSRRFVTRPGIILPLGWLEWADDPQASAKAIVTSNVAVQPQPEVPKAPTGPSFLRGALKRGVELDAELVAAGNPGRFKLFIREDFQPIMEVKYFAGFKVEDIGRIAKLSVKNVQGKGDVTALEFLRFK